MDLPSILLGLAFFAGVAFIVVRPLFDRAPATAQPLTTTTQLELTRDQNLTALRDLDFDHAMGKINDDDYQTQRAALVAQGVTLLKALDAAAPAAQMVDDALEAAIAQQRRGAAPSGARPVSAEAAMEAAIAQQRARPAPNGHSYTCATCGRPAQPGDKFCGKCGAVLPSLTQAKA